MNYYFYSLVIVGILNIVFGLFILVKNFKSRIHKYFSIAVIACGFWAIGLGMFIQSNTTTPAITWAVVYYNSPIYIAAFVLLFSFAFPYNKDLTKYSKILILSPTFLLGFFVTFFRSFLITGVKYNDWGKEIILGKLGYPIYTIYFSVYFYGALVNLLKKYIKSSGILKTQTLIMFLSLLVSGVFGTIFDLYLPFIGNYKLIWIGPQFTIFLMGLMFYAMARYKLFDIRVMVGRLFYILIFGLVFYVSFYSIIILHNVLFGGVFKPGALILGGFIAVFYVTVSNAANRFIKNKVDTTLINPGFNPAEVINEFNFEISTLLNTAKISEITISTIKKSISPEVIDILIVKDDQENSFIQNLYKNIIIGKIIMAINVWQNTRTEPIVLDLIESNYLGSFANMKNWLDEIVGEMKKNDIKVLVPLGGGKEINGILLLGRKSSNSPYNSIELNFLKSICSSSGLALNRAFLYHEVEDLNQNLQIKVDDATKELREKVDALEEARRKERDMLDILGHELRTPLTIVRNAIKVLTGNQSQGRLNELDLEKYLKMASTNTERELELLESMLTSTKIDNDNLNLIFEKVAMDDLLTNTLNAFSDKASVKTLTLRNNVKPGLSVYADHIRIQQVIDNLVDNAIKYTNSGGITINAEEIGSEIKLSVVDTGIGIPKEFIDKLGRKFYRINTYLDSSARVGMDIVRPGGAGLGLYVVYGLIKAMNGKIDVTSEIGKGSTFSFTIPKYIDQPVMQVGPKREKLYEKFARLKKEREERNNTKTSEIPFQSKSNESGQLPNLPTEN